MTLTCILNHLSRAGAFFLSIFIELLQGCFTHRLLFGVGLCIISLLVGWIVAARLRRGRDLLNIQNIPLGLDADHDMHDILSQVHGHRTSRNSTSSISSSSTLSSRRRGRSTTIHDDKPAHPDTIPETSHEALPFRLSIQTSRACQYIEDPVTLSSSPIAAERAPCAHINDLPPEVLTLILSYTLPSRQDNVFIDPPKAASPPFVLRRVCTLWNNIVKDTSTFWKSLNPPLSSCKDTRGRLNWYQQLDEIVHDIDDLTIRLPHEPAVDWDLFQYLFSMVDKCAALRVDLTGPHVSSTQTLFAFLPNPERIVRRKQSDGPEMKHLRTIEWFGSCAFADFLPTKLKLPWSSLRALPWGQLTSVALYLRLSLQDCVFIFTHGTSIENLVLHTVSESWEPELLGTRSELSRLHSLEIGSLVDLAQLFDVYSLPNLRKLHLNLDGEADHIELLHLPFHQLRQLTLQCSLTVQCAEQLFRTLTRVEDLAWSGIWDGADQDWSLHSQMPSLKSFVFKPANSRGWSMTTHIMDHLLPPSVETLEIPFPGDFEQRRLDQFHCLQSLTLNEQICPSDFFLLLSNVPSLQSGEFTVGSVEEFEYPNMSPIVLSSPCLPLTPLPTPIYRETTSQLSRLHLQLGHIPSPGMFFNSLSLPALVHLVIDARSYTASGCDGLVDLLQRSRSPVQRLEMKGVRLIGEVIVQYLRVLSPTLKGIVIDNIMNCQLGDAPFEALTHDGPLDEDDQLFGISSLRPTGCLCPYLMSFRMSPFVTDGESLFKMIESRWGSRKGCRQCGPDVEKLNSVFARFYHRQVVDSWVERRKSFEERGVNVELEFTDMPFFL